MSGLDHGRPARELEVGGEAWRAIEAWRGRAGHALCYFVPLEEGAPVPDDRRDRRATLEPEERLLALSEERLTSLLEESVPLTDTERRFADPRGRVWLAQNIGPVWAEGGVASGLTGVLFTSLEDPMERRSRPSGHLRGFSLQELRELLDGAPVTDVSD